MTILAVPVLVDASLALTAPIERRALERHRVKAQRRLNDVHPFVIAVTGSWGKTSTKNHIRDLLTGAVEVVASPASWNNTAGLSRTMNEYLTDGTEVLVAEMGMYGPGEIRSLCSWVKPDVGVICSIGPMHLERVGSLDAIAQAKAEILENVETAVLWVDDPRISALADSVSAPKVWRVGSKGTGPLDVEVSVDESSGDMSVWAGGQLVGVCPASSGAHPGNIGCAVAAALAFGASVRQIADRLSAIASPDHRATTGVNDSGVLVIDDTFNSNPVGALAAVGVLERTVAGRRAVVTPGMVELGPVQVAENEAFARAVNASGATLVVVGWTNRRALVSGAAGSAVVVSDREAAATWVREQLHEGDGVLWENDLPDHYP
jgi:UDP-N-acetylmuramoyl-tripeptide--D-alanyl-D-alanine ligase